MAVWTTVPAVAQVHDMQGETVRVLLAGDEQVHGVVLLWGSHVLELQMTDGPTLELEWVEVREVARYRSRGNTGRGLLVGALVGAAAAGIHAGVTWEQCTAICFGPQDRAGTIALAAVLGGAAGGLVGLVVGAVIKSPSWEPVAVPSAAAFRIGMRWTPH